MNWHTFSLSTQKVSDPLHQISSNRGTRVWSPISCYPIVALCPLLCHLWCNSSLSHFIYCYLTNSRPIRITVGTPLHNILAKLAASHTLWNFWHPRLWRLTKRRGIAIMIMHHLLPITHRKRIILRVPQILQHLGPRYRLPARH